MNQLNLQSAPSFIGAAVIAVCLTGCPSPAPEETGGEAQVQADSHEHNHSAPTTLAEAHEQLEHLAADIKAAFEADKPGDAHDALHEIGDVIKVVPELAKSVAADAEDEAKQVHDDLMDAFMKLDGTLHGGEKATWADVSDSVDAAMAKLAEWLPEGEDHDHDHQ